ncbi:MAG: ribbon-helix-helix protein, CopG family [Acidimicrobiales bacterium]
MPNAADLYGPNRPGPDPVFTERIELRLRPDQVQRLDRIAKAFRMTRSDIVRLAVDSFTDAVEEQPVLRRLEEVEVAP